MTLLIKDDLAQNPQPPQHKYTVEEFEELFAQAEYGDRLLELIHGAIIEKMPTEEHGVVAGNVVFALRGYVQSHKSGRVGVEVRHRLPNDQWNLRMPDVSYSTARRALVIKGSVPAMPDLAVEVQSPEDSVKAMREKATYYLANGAKLVWLLYPRKRMVEIYSANGEIDILHEGDTLSGEDVLPGFTLPVAKLSADPFTLAPISLPLPAALVLL